MTTGFEVGAARADDVCDTHMHVYDDRYPIAATAVLRPAPASVADYRHVAAELGVRRVVVVQPTTYGLDNTCTLEAVASLGSTARAVVVVDRTVTDDELERLHEGGARGARFHMLPGGAVGWADLAPVAERIAAFGWHVQLQLNGHDLAAHLDHLTALPTDLVIDHVGRFMPPAGLASNHLDALLRLLDGGRCWVKLSAPYESEPDPSRAYPRSAAVIERLIAHAPERLVWASNWPHPGQSDPPSAQDLIGLRNEWLRDEPLRRRVLVDNPAALYGF
jgi:D-galactarolactone isomerase